MLKISEYDKEYIGILCTVLQPYYKFALFEIKFWKKITINFYVTVVCIIIKIQS